VAKRKSVRKMSVGKSAGTKRTAATRTKRAPSRRAAGDGSKAPRRADPRYEVMKRFIRTKCDDYLQDPNISSVGIGYKTVGGKRSNELALQFSVDKKVRPEALEDVTSKPIPPTITFEGVSLPTDVVQRTFRPAYLLAQPEALQKDQRKQRLETMAPGISIANVRTTAGTLGTFVTDRRSGDRVILSNWHVLNTPKGVVGDQIVQPGPFDDNRTDLNVIGHLRRSHLGPAGDCAICSVESRKVDQTILELKTAVGRLGTAQLDDRVVKSGRTTGVTFGVVTRVEVITKMNYGDGVTASVGGFEVGVDSKKRPADGEISKGGDSGACWMAVDGGNKITDIMLGLHFAGEAEDSDAEFALACNATSVFEKLEIAPLGARGSEVLVPAAEAANEFRRGFDADFLSFRVPLAGFTDTLTEDLAKLSNSREIRYTHFSVCLSVSRKFPRLVAWNIDGSVIKKVSRTGIRFVKDERGGLEQFQIGDELYANNPIDRGHLARRADLCWGVIAEARQANRDSFFFSNITPQHERFNQGQRGGLWGRLEDAIFEDVDVDDLRVSLMGGPILRKSDPKFEGIPIPTEFWKLVAYTDNADGEDKVRAFILTQRNLIDDLVEPEGLELGEFRVFQVSLRRIEQESGVRFTTAFKRLDTMPAGPEALGRPSVRLITTQADLFA